MKLSKSGTSEAPPRKQLYRIIGFYDGINSLPAIIIETGLTQKQAKEWIAQHKVVDRHAGLLYYGYEEDHFS